MKEAVRFISPGGEMLVQAVGGAKDSGIFTWFLCSTWLPRNSSFGRRYVSRVYWGKCLKLGRSEENCVINHWVQSLHVPAGASVQNSCGIDMFNVAVHICRRLYIPTAASIMQLMLHACFNERNAPRFVTLRTKIELSLIIKRKSA